MAYQVVARFDGPDSVRIYCPECQQESALAIVTQSGLDGFRVDARGHVYPEWVCQRHYMKPNKAREYCRFAGFLQLLMD